MSTLWRIAWTDPPGSIAREFNLYISAVDTEVLRVVGRVAGFSKDVELPDDYNQYDVWVAPVVNNIEAHRDKWSKVTVTGATRTDTRPAESVSNFVVAQHDDHIQATWDKVADPFIESLEIRLGSAWEDGVPVVVVPSTACAAIFGWASDGNQTYMIKGVSKDYKYSPSVASSAVNVIRSSYLILQTTQDESGGGFAGTKTNSSVVSSKLRPSLMPATRADCAGKTKVSFSGTPWWYPLRQGATYEAPYRDATTVVDEKVEVALGLSAVNLAPVHRKWRVELRPSRDASGNYLPIGQKLTVGQLSRTGKYKGGYLVAIEIATTVADPASGTPGWTAWRRWVPGAFYHYRAVKLRFSWTLPWPYYYPEIATLVWKTFRINKKDEGLVEVTGTGGTTITFQTPFTATPKLVCGVRSGVVTISCTAISATSATIKIYTPSTGVETSGFFIDWHAMGV